MRGHSCFLVLIVGTFVLIAVLLITLTARQTARPVVPPPPGSDSTIGLVRFGAPRGHEAEGRLLVKSHFECFHDPRLKVSRWTAYVAEGDDTAHRDRYKGTFYPDPDLPPGQRAELYDYKSLWTPDKVGYDKGHQAPDATVKRFGVEAQRETYSLANITPQHSQVNQGIWQDLEAQIRHWSSLAQPVWVVTGPVFFARQETSRVGPDRVAVPHAYYAVLERGSTPDVMAFLVPNAAQATWYTNFDRFTVSVDSVEKLTGLDFMPDLPDTLENRLEAAAPRHVWP